LRNAAAAYPDYATLHQRYSLSSFFAFSL